MPLGELGRWRTSTDFKAQTQLAPAGLTEPSSLSCSQGPSWLAEPTLLCEGWVCTEGLALCQESRTQHRRIPLLFLCFISPAPQDPATLSGAPSAPLVVPGTAGLWIQQL